ncbi:MAG: hypothetical protein NC350_05585 [Corallococcus sp.]|nr:hypothetical protein [Corallococcus sp.]
MKTIRDLFQSICVVLGCVIGAGFVGGKELLLYFGSEKILSPIIFSVIICGCLCLTSIFCGKFGADSTESMIAALYGKQAFAIHLLLATCYFIVTSTMLAGANDCLAYIFETNRALPIFSFATAVISGIILRGGIEKIGKVNSIAMPFVIIFILVLFSVTPKVSTFAGAPQAISAVSYGMFNFVMSLGVFVATMSHKPLKYQISICIISCALIGLLAILQLCTFSASPFINVPIPALLAAKGNLPMTICATLAIYLATLTSVLSNAYPVIDLVNTVTLDKDLSVMITLFAALALSMLGFDTIIKYFYPFISVIGAITVISMAIYLRRNSACKIHKHNSKKNKTAT